MLENNHDITQWEQWNNAQLPISADDAWKEMEKLLDESSSEKSPIPFIPPVDNDKRKKKRFIVWWVVLSGILLMGSIFLFLNNKSLRFSYFNPTKKQLLNYPIDKRTVNSKTDATKKVVEKTKKEVLDSKDDRLSDTELHPTKTSSNTVNNLSQKISNIKKNENALGEPDNHQVIYSSKKGNLISQNNNNEKVNTIKTNAVIDNKVASKKGKQNLYHITKNPKSVSSNKNKLPHKANDKEIKSAFLSYTTQINGEKPNTNNDKNNLSQKENIDKQTNKYTTSVSKNALNEPIIATSDTTPNLSKDSTQKRISKPLVSTSDTNNVVSPKDTIKSKKEGDVIKKLNKLRLSAGLQWNVSLPMTDNKSNTEKQLIPGLWFAKDIGNKSSVSVSVNPFVMQTNTHIVLENKTQNLDTLVSNLKLDNTWYITDSFGTHINTNIKVNRVATLLQSFGYRAALDYKYQVHKKWQLSLGVEYNKIVSAYINDKIMRVSDSLVAKDATASYKNGSDLWNLFQHNYFSASAAISYSPVAKLSISVGFHKPFNSITNNTNQGISPSSYFLNIRWRLWKSKK